MPFDPAPSPLASPSITAPLIRATQVAAIIRQPDPIRRNLQITQSYRDLSIAVGRRLGQRDGSWCLFATWASKTAGGFIRGEWLTNSLRHLLTMTDAAPLEAIAALDTRIRRSVAVGNTLVYTEMAPLFVTLLDVLDTPAPARQARLARTTARMRPGRVEDGGEDALAHALTVMVECASLPPGPHRSQRMLLANLLIGAHEQFRLQSAIEGALDAVWLESPRRRRWSSEVKAWVAPWLRQRLTRWMMSLGLPEGPLSLGRDVPALPGGTMFPADLQRVDDPELTAVLARFDRTPNTTQGSAALDWSDYGDRMNYVSDLFRSRQQSANLWNRPFTEVQADAIRCGLMPRGSL